MRSNSWHDALLTRRDFVQRSSTVALVGIVSGRLRHHTVAPAHAPNCVRDAQQGMVDPALVRSLAMRSLDAARAAGATYADVRVTRTLREDASASWASETWTMSDREELALGVRALVNGYWGFASTPYWTPDEAARVGTMAAAQAAIFAKGPSRPLALDHAPAVTGSWQTPIVIDPFRLTMEEKLDYLRSTIVAFRRLLPEKVRTGDTLEVGATGKLLARFGRQECALATSEGTYVTQTFYNASGNLPISYQLRSGAGAFTVQARGLLQTGKGWELLSDAKLLEQAPAMLEELESKRPLPLRGVEVGRTTIVCDAATTAELLAASLGRASEIDRALGYEANATGTSYFGPDPLAMLGTAVASPLVSVSANRSLPNGLATVKWDAEGVVPDDFPLVRDGTLVDYQTTREQAMWLAPWYQRSGAPVKSHGCADASDAAFVTMQTAPNLVLAPASGSAGFEELVASMTSGVVLEGCTTVVDFQCHTGKIAGGTLYQVRRGKRVSRLINAGVLFDTAGLWKSVAVIGGAASVEHRPLTQSKGEPRQSTVHTVSSPPIVIKEMGVFDITRKA